MTSQECVLELQDLGGGQAVTKVNGVRTNRDVSGSHISGPCLILEGHPETDLRQRRVSRVVADDKSISVHDDLGSATAHDKDGAVSEEDPLDRLPTSEEDTFESIQVQLDIIKSLREQSWPMSRKLQTLRSAKHIVKEYTVKLSRLDLLRESRIRFLRRAKRQINNFIVFFIPWEKRIRKIQGHFGAGIGSFFLFLRSLVWVNTVMFVFTTLFIIVPQILAPSTSTKMPDELRSSASSLIAIIDAKGHLEYSFLFYGYYSNKSLQIGNVRYPLPLAYIVVFLGTYVFSVLTILRAMAQEQRNSQSSGQHDQYKFGWRVFTAWDFLITEKETAENKVASITTTIKEQILEETEKAKEENIHLLRFLRVLANFLVICVLGGSGYAIFWVVQRSEDRKTSNVPPTILEQYEISLAMTILNMVCPSLFVLIGMLEKYHPRTALYWELTRIMVMYLGNLYVLLISLLNMINESMASSKTSVTTNSTVFPTNASTATIPPSTISTTTFPLNSTASPTNCWETVVGQELLKVTVLDTIALVISIITSDLLTAMVVRFLNCCPGRMLDLENLIGYPEFTLAENVLQLIYNQGLIWIAMVFSPGIIIVNLVKSVIIMYIRSWAVMVTNVPPKRIFKASHQFYLVLLLLMLFLCLLAVGYAMVQLEPSLGCGPFRGKHRMYVVITDAVDNSPAVVNAVLDYLSGPGVIIPIIIILAIAIFYFKSKASSYRKMNRDLVMQLQYARTEDRKRTLEIAAGGKRSKGSKKKKPAKPPALPPPSESPVWRTGNALSSAKKDKKRQPEDMQSLTHHEFISNGCAGNQHMRNGKKPPRRRQKKTAFTSNDSINIMVHRDHREPSISSTELTRTRNHRHREFQHFIRNRHAQLHESSEVEADDSDTDNQAHSTATVTSGTQHSRRMSKVSVTAFSEVPDTSFQSSSVPPLENPAEEKMYPRPGSIAEYQVQMKSQPQSSAASLSTPDAKSLRQSSAEIEMCTPDMSSFRKGEASIDDDAIKDIFEEIAKTADEPQDEGLVSSESSRRADWGGSLGDMFGNDLQMDTAGFHSNQGYESDETKF
ncbi:transmembrane channel-like protein 2-A isoform X2 [Nematostella vectensis]|uniref:transmembrane channel-like protein 2-A isoform X2 n=1 Tax=Nematostella vectensis TaxID=45351 RepID=UPI0020777DC1|nr:transmembrane channel-like protein 2-A isoform X2 [Nematostella vectensis]